MSDKPQTDPEVVKRLRESFATDDAMLQLALTKARADFNHAGVKGDVLEVATRSFLRSHLPRKFDVGTGEVIDRFGARSAQLDVIILNDEQPFVHGIDTHGSYLAEGVSAVGEIKARMGTKELVDILEKGTILRTLRPMPLLGDQIHSNEHDTVRFVTAFPYFALALESTLTSETILQKLRDSGEVDAPDGGGVKLPKLDALFVLDRGIFRHFGNGLGGYQFIGADGVSQPGWVASEDDGVLVALFNWLNSVMPRITRAGSIAVPYLTTTYSPPRNQGYVWVDVDVDVDVDDDDPELETLTVPNCPNDLVPMLIEGSSVLHRKCPVCGLVQVS
jgi:hypothetical protein